MLQEKKDERDAAARMQAAWRGHAARVVNADNMLLKREADAALRLQRVARAFNARRVVSERRAAPVLPKSKREQVKKAQMRRTPGLKMALALGFEPPSELEVAAAAIDRKPVARRPMSMSSTTAFSTTASLDTTFRCG